MPWPAVSPGRLLERSGDAAPRGMIAHDRTRLIGRLRHYLIARSAMELPKFAAQISGPGFAPKPPFAPAARAWFPSLSACRALRGAACAVAMEPCPSRVGEWRFVPALHPASIAGRLGAHAMQPGFLHRNIRSGARRRLGRLGPKVTQSQILRRNSSLWIKLEQVSEVRCKSLTCRKKFPPRVVDKANWGAYCGDLWENRGIRGFSVMNSA